MLIEPHSVPTAEGPTVAIVGAGASGLLTAAHLLRAASRRQHALQVVLIERSARTGGVAYSTSDPGHRLNVTAARMSGLSEAPDHFVRWRHSTTRAYDPGEYAPRAHYRRYLEELLAEACRSGGAAVTLARVSAEVTGVARDGSRLRLDLAGLGVLEADAAVLALGNMATLPPAGCESVAAHARYVNDPWAPQVLDRLEANGKSMILLVGSGLTMVDVASTITERFPLAKMLAVSRSGLLPRAHLAGRISPQPRIAIEGDLSLPKLVDMVLAESAAGNPAWHQLVDDLRPLTQALWKRLDLDERAKFLATRHRAWCVRRHRMPPQVAARLAETIGRDRLTVRSGTVELAPATESTLVAQIAGTPPTEIDLAINCTGPSLDPRTSEDRLIAQLLRDGHVRTHPLGVGFDTAPDGAFISAAGVSDGQLFTIGPPRIGELYETTAIPEIRVQAEELAAALVRSIATARAGETDRGRVELGARTARRTAA